MERYALADYHYSLFVPVSAWVDHVNNLYTSLLCRGRASDLGTEPLVLDSLDELVTAARDREMSYPVDLPSTELARRFSAYELPAAGDQAISRDWGTFARSYAMLEQRDEREAWNSALEHARAEREVHALVDEDEDMEVEEEDEDEFVDYDGAKPWLPSMSEMRRSASNSSAQSFDSVTQWRAGVPHGKLEPDAQVYRQDVIFKAPAYQPQLECAQCGREECRPSKSTEHNIDGSLGPTLYKDTGIYLEPGISIVRPPNAIPHKLFTQPASYHSNVNLNPINTINVTANNQNRWGDSAWRW
jgi:hypothetical protein